MLEEHHVLHLYTLYYPQGNYEVFLENEIQYLSEHFEEVKIFPFRRLEKASRNIPSNCKVIYTEVEDQRSSLISGISKMGRNILRWKYLKDLRYQLGALNALILKKERLKAELNRDTPVIHYSYWFDEWATVLGMLTKEGVISGYSARAHGFDLYDERQSIGYHPNRGLQISGLKKLFPVSNMGAQYLKERIPSVPIRTMYLGTEDHGMGPIPKDDRLRILSIAKLIPLKRVEALVKVLQACDRPIHWTHIGDGPGYSGLERLKDDLPSHIQVDLKGAKPNDEVMSLMKNEAFHLLISLSETEGLPVSMMEAMSFGIPVLSTDVGGVNEIVTEDTGLLIDPELDIPMIAKILDDWMLTGMQSSAFRVRVRGCWEKDFSAAKNYSMFIEALKSTL